MNFEKFPSDLETRRAVKVEKEALQQLAELGKLKATIDPEACRKALMESYVAHGTFFYSASECNAIKTSMGGISEDVQHRFEAQNPGYVIRRHPSLNDRIRLSEKVFQ